MTLRLKSLFAIIMYQSLYYSVNNQRPYSTTKKNKKLVKDKEQLKSSWNNILHLTWNLFLFPSAPKNKTSIKTTVVQFTFLQVYFQDRQDKVTDTSGLRALKCKKCRKIVGQKKKTRRLWNDGTKTALFYTMLTHWRIHVCIFIIFVFYWI